ncbi:hypothetical protein CR513_46175, partial [Mucuna pruriens]
MVTMFINTLPSPYYDKVVGNVASNFADLVVNRGGHLTRKVRLNQQRRWLRQKDDVRKEEGRDQRYANRAHLPLDQDKHFLVAYPSGISASSDTTNTVHSTKPTANGRGGYCQCQVNTASREKVTQGADTDPHDLYQALSPTTRTKTNRGSFGLNVHNNPLPAHGTTTVNAISHIDERVVSPNRRRDEEPGYTVDPANQVVVATEGAIARWRALYSPNDQPGRNGVSIVVTKPVYNNNTVSDTSNKRRDYNPQNHQYSRNRGGRIFSPEALRNKEPDPARKEKTTESPKRTMMEEEA